MKQELPNITHETVVFTKHARERLGLRNLGEDMVIQVMRNPKQTYKTDDGKIKFIGKTMGAKVHAVCKPIPEENKWLVITLWIRGEDDEGNFVNHRKVHKNEQSTFEILYWLFFILLIVLAVIAFYFLQQT